MPKQPTEQSARRKWLFRFAPIPLLLLLPLLAEGALRLFGVGCSTCFVERKGDHWFPNEKFAAQFFGPRCTSRPVYFKVPIEKPANALRVVVLGESAAMGTPDPAFCFGRILEVMLETNFPGKKIELVNAAMRGIDSHIVRRIARDCAQLKPDVFIIYMGNNEVIGLHGPEPGCSGLSQSLWMIRTGDCLKSTRLGQLLRRSAAKGQKPEQDMEFFRRQRLAPDDWRREKVMRNFASDLRDVCEAGRKAGAKVLVSTVPVNMKDFPPLASVPGKHNAEEQFRLGNYQQALDWDALQFRADSRVNEKIREVANNVVLVDTAKAFADADGGVPGAKLFRDHVHPTFEGDYLIARTLLNTLDPKASVPSVDDCKKRLAYTDWHDAQIQLAVTDLTSRPPYHDQLNYRERQARAEKLARERIAQLTVPQVEAGLQISLAAVKRRPDDWLLRHNCSQLYQALGRPAGAAEHLEAITKLYPHVASFQMLLAQALKAGGRADAAAFHLAEAAKLDPEIRKVRR